MTSTEQKESLQNSILLMNASKMETIHIEIIFLLTEGLLAKEVDESIGARLMGKPTANHLRDIYALINKHNAPGEPKVGNASGIYKIFKMYAF